MSLASARMDKVCGLDLGRMVCVRQAGEWNSQRSRMGTDPKISTWSAVEYKTDLDYMKDAKSSFHDRHERHYLPPSAQCPLDFCSSSRPIQTTHKTR